MFKFAVTKIYFLFHVLRQGVAFDIIKLLMSENISMDFNGKF